ASLCRAMDRFANRLVGSTTANVAAHRAVDFGIGRFGLAGEERRSTHDLPGLAIPALRNIGLKPCLLYGMAAVGGESFNGRDALSSDVRNRCAARAKGLAVDVHRAGAA